MNPPSKSAVRWWEANYPGLWAAVTVGYGEGWWDKLTTEIDAIESERADKGLCAFCAKSFVESDQAVEVLPPRPYAGPFCCIPRFWYSGRFFNLITVIKF